MQVRKHNVLLLMGVLSFVAVLMSGCLKSVDNTPSKPKAYLSLMYLAPGAPSVDIFFNDTKANQNAFASGAYTSIYNQVDKGIFSITLKKAGGDSVVSIISPDIYDSLNFYTAVFYNSPGSGVQGFTIHDDYSGISTTKTLYRFFHMSPDIGAVDVYFNNEVWESGRQYADNSFGSSSYNMFQQKAGNSYTIAVKKAGSDSVIAQTNTTLDNQQAYTIFLKGTTNGTGNNVLGVNVLQSATQ